jgi:predicted aspartyl protease
MVDDLGSSFVTTESLAVGTHLLSQVKVSILPGSNSDGHEELLRMNFLKQFR